MKAIWDMGEDISIPDLIVRLKEKHGKDYARTTVVTFLLKLSDKGFVRTYRKGKLSYAHAMKSEDEYRKKLLVEELEYWFRGDGCKMMDALAESGRLPGEVVEQIKDVVKSK